MKYAYQINYFKMSENRDISIYFKLFENLMPIISILLYHAYINLIEQLFYLFSIDK